MYPTYMGNIHVVRVVYFIVFKFQTEHSTYECVTQLDGHPVARTCYLPGYQESELRYLTFLYTCPLTILYAAEQAGLGKHPIYLSFASSSLLSFFCVYFPNWPEFSLNWPGRGNGI